MAIDLQSPFVPTYDDEHYGYEYRGDPTTTAYRDSLNQVYYYQPTMPPAFPAYIRYDGSGIGDENYNVGYHQLDIYPTIKSSFQAGRYEAPDVPVTHLPFMQNLYNTTLIRSEVAGQPVYRNLRAPAINEGV